MSTFINDFKLIMTTLPPSSSSLGTVVTKSLTPFLRLQRHLWTKPRRMSTKAVIKFQCTQHLLLWNLNFFAIPNFRTSKTLTWLVIGPIIHINPDVLILDSGMSKNKPGKFGSCHEVEVDKFDDFFRHFFKFYFFRFFPRFLQNTTRVHGLHAWLFKCDLIIFNKKAN